MCPGTETAEGWGLVPSYPTPLPGHQDCGSTPAPQSQTRGDTRTTLLMGGALLAPLLGCGNPKPTPSSCAVRADLWYPRSGACTGGCRHLPGDSLPSKGLT